LVKAPPSSSISPPSPSLLFHLLSPPLMPQSSKSHKAEAKFNVTTECAYRIPLDHLFLSLTPLSFKSPTSRSPCRSRYRKHRPRKICPLSWSTYQLCHRRCTPSTCRLFRWKRHDRQIAHRQRCGCKRSKVCTRISDFPIHYSPPLGMAALLAVSCIMLVTHS
jgi:hypothetical protein